MYSLSREWVYRDIKPTIFAEELLLDTTTGKPPMDYKFYCFNGAPIFIQVDVDRFLLISAVFDLHWNLQSYDLLSIRYLPLDPSILTRWLMLLINYVPTFHLSGLTCIRFLKLSSVSSLFIPKRLGTIFHPLKTSAWVP